MLTRLPAPCGLAWRGSQCSSVHVTVQFGLSDIASETSGLIFTVSPFRSTSDAVKCM